MINNLEKPHHLFTIPIDSSPLPAEQLFLCEQEIIRLKKMKSNSAAHIFKWSRYILKNILSSFLSIEVPQITFNYSENQKPFLKNADIHFNISHTNTLICIGLSRYNVCGIDCEKPRLIHNLKELEQKVFTASEIETLSQQPYFKDSFFLGWVIKESLAKMEGSSIFKAVNDYQIATIFPTHAISKHINTQKLYTTYLSTYQDHFIGFSGEKKEKPQITHLNSQNFKFTLNCS